MAQRLTTTQWLICAIAAIGFAFDIYELLMLPLIIKPAIAALSAPLVDELVLCGEGYTSIAVLAWPNRAALESAGVAALKSTIRERLTAHNAANPGASTSVRRVLLLQEPPNAGAHELSDKGTVNRSAVLARRAADVERLYKELADVDVIAVD